jgi:hypothetical protein
MERAMSFISNKPPEVPARVRRLVEKINRRYPPHCIHCQCLLHPEEALLSESGARFCEKCAPRGTLDERVRAAEGVE